MILSFYSVMYSYFALSCMGYHPPKFLAMTITFLQLTQMIVGCAINIWAHNYLATAPPHTCHISDFNIKLSMTMYFSYFVLFARFFYKAYLGPKGKGKKPMKSEPIAENKHMINAEKFDSLRQRNGIIASH